MKFVITLTVLLFAFTLQAQTDFPGGISSPVYWGISRQNSSGEYCFIDKITGKTFSLQTAKGSTVNGHLSSFLDGDKDNLSLLFADKPTSLTAFVVYCQPDSKYEQTLLTLANSQGTASVMTTQRASDLQQYRYINYDDIDEPLYRISTFMQVTDSLYFTELKTGIKPSDKNIPVKNFKGYIAEIIVYDCLPNFKQRLRVESYLAVKYGISLMQSIPVSYFDASSKTVWDADRQGVFKHNITAVGRDDASGLKQQSSVSNHCPNLLHITAKDAFRNQQFMFWADNNAPLRFASSSCEFRPLARRWKVTLHNMRSIKTSLQIKLNELSNSFYTANEQLLCVIDSSGTGQFPQGHVYFIPLQVQNGVINFDADFNNNDIFTFAIASKSGIGYEENFLKGCEDGSNEESSLNSNLAYSYLYPNPTSTKEYFTLDIGLYKATDLTLTICNASGAVVVQDMLRGSDYYIYHGKLSVTGYYIIYINGSEVNKSFKIICK